MQGELRRVCVVQYQPVTATPVHVPDGRKGGDENKEEQSRRAASRQMGQPAPGCCNEGFPSVSVFDPSEHSRNTEEGDGDEFHSTTEGGGRKR